ncbi:MAG: 3'-5' exonuclease [Bacteroidetes bacterium]|nr:MAG: 3'-5' exonuclease [Bacteroidota bacterium]
MEALRNIQAEKILFLDIETAPQYPSYKEVPGSFQKLWDTKAKRLLAEKDTPSDVYKSAGIYAEFGKVVCITVGMFNGKSFRLKAFYGDVEKTILAEFSSLLEKQFSTDSHYLCAHNGKEFDFPFLARRILINGLKIPRLLDNAGKKPWEIRHLDTMELWKFGDYKSYTSLNLLAEIFGIPSPKGDMDGSMMYKVYWEDKDWDRIVKYNHRDVLTVAQVFLKFKGEKLIEEKDVVIA